MYKQEHTHAREGFTRDSLKQLGPRMRLWGTSGFSEAGRARPDLAGAPEIPSTSFDHSGGLPGGPPDVSAVERHWREVVSGWGLPGKAAGLSAANNRVENGEEGKAWLLPLSSQLPSPRAVTHLTLLTHQCRPAPRMTDGRTWSLASLSLLPYHKNFNMHDAMSVCRGKNTPALRFHPQWERLASVTVS